MNKKRVSHQPYRYSPYYFLAPLILLFVLINLYPLLDTLFMSFHKWERGSAYSMDNISLWAGKIMLISVKKTVLKILLNTVILFHHGLLILFLL